jgi:AdoMet-dependent heme synthase
MNNNKSKVDYALWEVTQKCNLKCIHCRADASPDKKEGKLIEGKNARKLIDELSELGCPTLALTGGEPLLRKDLIEIIKYANSKNIKTRIQSNGLLLTEAMADKLKGAGILSYGIGLDGANEQINDNIRNKKGALKKAIWAIKILKERDIKVHVEFTVTKLNINELKGTLDLLESLGVDTFLARAAVFTGRAKANNSIFRLSPEEYRKFLEEICMERKRRKIIMNCQDPLYHLVDKELVEKMKKHGDIYSGKIISGCTAGINMIHIHSNGNIGICTFLNIILGNIFNNSLVKIWNNRDKIKGVDFLIKRQCEGQCKICADRFICGGCRARALYIKNNLLGHDPYCWKYLKK